MEFSQPKTDCYLNSATRASPGSIETAIPYRQRCVKCFRPSSECYCQAIPSIENRTEFLIVQHSRERDHPFNTARMVREALLKSKLIFGTTESLSKKHLPIQPRAGLLYPSSDARTLSDLPPAEKPEQLVIVDGTWSQARTMLRDLPQLAVLPRYQIVPNQPGQYRIRLEPTETSLSTVEAAVAALRELEPETRNLGKLLDAFDLMVRKQLAHPSVGREHYAGGSKNGHTINIPNRLRGDANGIVVAYGEAAYRESTQLKSANRNAPRPPLYWVAQRLGTNERFASILQSDVPMTDSFLEHLEISRDCLESGISTKAFGIAWDNFVGPDDLVVVYNQGIIQLLKSIQTDLKNIQFRNYLTLKSIDFNPSRSGLTLSQFLALKCLSSEPSDPELGRAGKRLANAVALVNHLRSL